MDRNGVEKPHVFPEGRRPGEILFAALTMIIALGLLSAIFWQTEWLPSKRLTVQPRFWPALSLGGVVLFGLLNAVSRLRVYRTPGRWTEAGLWVKSLEYIGWYMLYVWCIPVLGYLLSTLAFCTGLTLRLGYRGRVIIYAALFGLGVVLFFKAGMNVKIPGGAVYEFAPEAIRYALLRYF